MRRQGGFTLVELIVVIAVIGILAALAVAQLDARPTPADAGRVMAALVRETARKAVALGPVRDDVAAAEGTTARTRLLIEDHGDRIELTIEALVEDPVASHGTWTRLASRAIGPGLAIGGSTPRAVLEDGEGPEEGPPADAIELRCYAEGTCDARTIYFAGKRSVARTAVLPLGGSPVVFTSW